MVMRDDSTNLLNVTSTEYTNNVGSIHSYVIAEFYEQRGAY